MGVEYKHFYAVRLIWVQINRDIIINGRPVFILMLFLFCFISVKRFNFESGFRISPVLIERGHVKRTGLESNSAASFRASKLQ